ncbi:MAG: PPA1309 family protein [Actinomycetota bacterium]|nr:PPA1309 family protein [Actinomycetota bacterium]
MQLMPDSPLRQVALEIEAHVADAGWDQAPRLYALVPTADLLTQEPALAQTMGIDAESATDSLTSIEQEPLPVDRSLEDALAEMMWPDQVIGCAAVIERIMLPPEVEDELPDDADALLEFVASHPARQEVRLVAAVTRDGTVHSAVRARIPEDSALLEGPDLVPGLIAQLQQTLAD